MFARYGTRVDAQSAREILAGRMAASSAAAAATPTAAAAQPAKPKAKAKPKQPKAPAPKTGQAAAAGGALGTLTDLLGSSQGKAIQKEVVRGVFGMLKKRL